MEKDKKTLGKLKLNQLRKAELEKREMNALKGGCDCGTACGCGGDTYSFGREAQNPHKY